MNKVKIRIICSFGVLLLTLFAQQSYSQIASWSWAKASQSNGDLLSSNVEIDNFGDIYYTGFFQGPTLTFGSITLNGPNNQYDIYLLKTDSLGNEIWAKTFGGAGDELGSLTKDNDGNLYMFGTYKSSTIVFDTITLFNSNPQNNNIFIVKLDTSGRAIWAESIGGPNSDDFNVDIKFDSKGNLFVRGTHTGSITFGSYIFPGSGTWELFLAKFSPSGNVLWAENFSSLSFQYFRSLIVDPYDQIYCSGTFAGSSLYIGGTVLANSNPGTEEFFIVKFDSLGSQLWSTTAGSSNSDEADLYRLSNGNLLLGINFSGATLTYKNVSFQNSNPGTYDFCIILCDSNGNVISGRKFGTVGTEKFLIFLKTNDSFPYFTGSFNSFNFVLGQSTISTQGISDDFLAKLDSNLNANLVVTIGGPSYEFISGIVADVNGDMFFQGIFNDPLITLSPFVLNGGAPGNGYTSFYAKLTFNSVGSSLIENSIKEISIYPNPSKEKINIESELFFQNAEAIIFDSFGRLIDRISGISGPKFIIQRNRLDAGVYFLYLNDNNKSTTHKLVFLE